MNLIIHYIDHENVIDGNTITLLDLFFFMKLHNIDISCIFFTISSNQYQILYTNLINSRYKLNIDVTYNYLKSIGLNIISLCGRYSNLTKYILRRFDNVIMTDATYNRLKDVKLLYKNLSIITSWFSFYNKNEYPNNTKIFNENHLCGEVNYYKKIYVDLLKDVKCNTEKLFILANGERRLTQHELNEIDNKYFGIKILCQDKVQDLDTSRYKLYCIGQPLFDYSTYLYVPTKTYEFAPRMLVESIFLNKKIEIYKYPSNINQRFFDIEINDIQKYKLSIDDELIKSIRS